MINGKKIIALCISRMAEMTTYELVSSLNKAATAAGHRVFVYSLCSDLYFADERRIAEADLFELMDFSVIDTVVIAVEKIKNDRITRKIINRAKENDVPVITIDGSYEDCINLSFDFRSGFEKVVRHVVDRHGITDVHYMAGQKGNPFSEERREVIRQVLDEKGAGFTEENVSYGDFWETPTKEATRAIIASGHLPRAIICANDIMAINVCSVLQENGIRVPEDVAVTGFDGIEEIYFYVPRITSCSCSHIIMGQRLAGLCSEIFDNGLREGQFFVEPELIVSGSCGCGDDMSVNVPILMHMLNNRIYRMQEDVQALSRRSEKIQNSMSIEEIVEHFDSYVFSDTTCLINKRCLIPQDDPFCFYPDEPFDEIMCMLHNFGSAKDESPADFERRYIVPDMERLLEKQCPLVFSVIDYQKTPLGYIVFHFFYDDVTSYCRIPMVVNALNNAIGGYINNSSHRFLLSRIEEMYRTDALTGLCNRLSFSHEYKEICSRVKETNGTLTAALADLDDLKGINDRYGHVAGDKAIHAVAEALRHACPEDAVLVRIGGDEMLAVISHEESEEKIKSSMRFFLGTYNETSGEPFTVSASIGVYTTSDPAEMKLETLIKKSDELMYSEKRLKKKPR